MRRRMRARSFEISSMASSLSSRSRMMAAGRCRRSAVLEEVERHVGHRVGMGVGQKQPFVPVGRLDLVLARRYARPPPPCTSFTTPAGKASDENHRDASAMIERIQMKVFEIERPSGTGLATDQVRKILRPTYPKSGQLGRAWRCSLAETERPRAPAPSALWR